MFVGIALLIVLVVFTFPTILRQIPVMTTYLPALKKHENIHIVDDAASNSVKTFLDVGDVLVGKPAVSYNPGV